MTTETATFLYGQQGGLRSVAESPRVTCVIMTHGPPLLFTDIAPPPSHWTHLVVMDKITWWQESGMSGRKVRVTSSNAPCMGLEPISLPHRL
ncbi:hypothetical protein DPMN_172700 [Dreissena polymorpha]|uniref:Uncharacterized protein n=1 Tax=Dreissena polymorpha TaxID=45954 RepID=A0A9D4E0A3_DREPO|nr:hypothetical protein DPMN_172700 [Dreissena polymorpha]